MSQIPRDQIWEIALVLPQTWVTEFRTWLDRPVEMGYHMDLPTERAEKNSLMRPAGGPQRIVV